METYIAILRGINVSGQKKIKMAELREHLAELKYEALQTYIQSGNILFQSQPVEESMFEQEITDKIKEKYGFDVPVMVRTLSDWKRIHAENPFTEVPVEEYNRLFVAFLDQEPKPANEEVLKGMQFETEEFVMAGREVYYYCRNGAGRAKLSNNLLEKKLKVSATSRNFKTVEKLLTLAGVDLPAG